MKFQRRHWLEDFAWRVKRVSSYYSTVAWLPCENITRTNIIRCVMTLFVPLSENRKTTKTPKISKLPRRNHDKRAKVQRRNPKMAILQWQKQMVMNHNHSSLVTLVSKLSRNLNDRNTYTVLKI
jgi:hypothetical protein